MKKLLLLTGVLVLTLTISFAQEIEWQKTIGGIDSDLLNSIQQTADGGFILAGMSLSNISGDKTENNTGNWDFWIIKTDVDGNIQWQNTIGGNDYDQPNAIQQTTDGGYIVGGSSDSNISGEKTENSNGLSDFWVLKLDNTGNIQWQQVIGGSGDDMLVSIQQTADGGYVLGGSSDSNISGDKTENSYGLSDYWIVKIDDTGNVQWQQTIGGGGYDVFRSVQLTVDGGFVIGGYSDSNISGNKTENSNGFHDFWIVKTDSSGIIQWQNTIGGSSVDQLFSAQQTFDGGYIMGGSSISNLSGDKTENSNGSFDYWMVKTDASGNIQWQNSIGGSDNDALYSLKQTTDGGFIMAGFSASGISGDKTENSFGAHDFWVVKTNNLGAIQWQNNIGGSGDEVLVDIQETTDEGFVLAGFSNSETSGDLTGVNNGGDDFWVIKLTNKYNIITGSLFADLNSNNSQDLGEPLLVNKKITEQATGRFTFTNQNGDYLVSVLDSGNFDVAPVILNNYTASPASHNSYFPGFQQTDNLNDFAFQPQGVLNDLCVTITPLSPFRSGFLASYMISYENVGTTTITNPSVVFSPDLNMSYSTATVVPSAIALDSVVWTLNPLLPFESGEFMIVVSVDSGLAIGSMLNSSARIEPVSGDANPACNYSDWDVIVTGSFDPNDILVSDEILTTAQLTSQPFSEYIIRFQNTGNDTAFTVNILNPIDIKKLNLNSFEFVNASHNVELNWRSWENNMEFKFNNILLPDSNINELLSHGYVRYRIQPKTNLVAGNFINNNAGIYFDFNDPVLTNTAVTNIVLPTGLQTLSDKYDYAIYPNPTSGTTFIEVSAIQSAQAEVTLLTMQGKLISFENHQLKVGPNKLDLNTSELSSGIYLVRMVIDGNLVVKKLVKM
ncbi:MAG: T9SS type A sorting domain-containing protein [Bacteroidetes bacterium]|nr:T9SS type A sorting domain-containing protein [Bacteroidota bacterium]